MRNSVLWVSCDLLTYLPAQDTHCTLLGACTHTQVSWLQLKIAIFKSFVFTYVTQDKSGLEVYSHIALFLLIQKHSQNWHCSVSWSVFHSGPLQVTGCSILTIS